MPESNELRIFISSTFSDLQEEREHLVKKIFPEIRTLCRERGITFTEVDLRWGLTEDEGTYGRIIRTCLEEIDRCRPYFIGITGSRYGYVPDYLEIQKDPELLRLFPWVEDAVVDEMSITEMEIKYGVLDDPGSVAKARFYARRHRASLEDKERDQEADRLESLQEKIRQSGAPIETFRDPRSLGELVYDDLIAIIKSDFADATPPTPLQQERAKHRAFSASRRLAYIANPIYLKLLNSWYDSDEPPMVVYAESGSGKSSLIAYWAEQMRRKDPNLFVVEHYVGIGAGAADHLGLIKHIMQEIKERFDRSEELPETPEEIENGLGQWLGYAVHGLQRQGTRMILILDGLNQLGEKALHLRWIPDVMSPEVRLVLTSTIEETLVRLRDRGWSEMGMQPLSQREREAVVVRYLSEYRKELPGDVVRRIAVDVKCAHPLFLRTLLEELRMYGSHERIEQHVDRLLGSTGTEDLFQHVLERMEEDYNRRTVREVMSLLWASRSGLTEQELAAISGASRLKLATLLLGLEYHLLRTDGQLSFFHDYLRRAVKKRYLSEEHSTSEQWRLLAEYFAKAEPDVRGTRELIHALEHSGQREQLDRVLSDIVRFELIAEDGDMDEVLRLWSERDPGVVAEAYRSGLERWRQDIQPDTSDLMKPLGHVAELLGDIGAWNDSQQVREEQRDIANAAGDGAGESAALSGLAEIARLQGRADEAESLARKAEKIARNLGDRRGVATAVGTRGNVHYRRGEYSEAMACHAECESIARELGDQQGLSSALDNRGLVLNDLGEYDEAMACHAESERIARELGNRHSISSAVGNRGNVHAERGEFDEALACYAEQERIARDLGNRKLVAIAVGNRGIEHARLGAYAEAVSCLIEALGVHHHLGFKHGVTYWLYGLAEVLVDIAQKTEIMPRFLQQYSTDVSEPLISCEPMIPENWKPATLELARQYADKTVALSRQLSKPDTLFVGNVLLARISAAEKDAETATIMLRKMLEEVEEDSQRAELHYLLWRIPLDTGNTLTVSDEEAENHRTTALQLYTVLFERVPSHGYQEQIVELTSGIEPADA